MAACNRTVSSALILEIMKTQPMRPDRLVTGRAWGIGSVFNPIAPTDSFNDIGLLGLIS
jgi:hypothetical protein